MGKLEGKVALVTGAARGIGKEIALDLAREGGDIIAVDLNQAELDKLAGEIRALGRKVLTAVADVSKKSEVDKMVENAIKTFGKIDILVNNAGITRHAPFLSMTETEWDEVMAVNLKSVFLMSQSVAKHMITRKYGKIISISSISSTAPEGNMSNYGASKAGINNLTKSMAVSLGEYGINVNAVASGSIMTEMLQFGRTTEQYQQLLEKRAKQAVLNRLGEVQDIAKSVVFLATDDAAFITGQTIAVDGGRVLQG
jgi:3-oxoacyl-[acyl-carrier protein] reductase